MTGCRLQIGVAAATRLAILGISLGVTTALRWACLFPNNDPIMAVMLPCAKRGRLAAVTFPVVAMVLFDVLAGRVGVWTAVTAGTYGLLGLAFSFAYAALARRGRTVGTGTFVVSSVAGVLVFDFVTGPVLSSVMFRVSFAEALVGQVPFTLRHLTSVSLYAVAVSPALDSVFRYAERLGRALDQRLVAASHAE